MTRCDERCKYAYLCVEQQEKNQDREVDLQSGEDAQLEVVADDDTLGVVSQEEQQETQVVTQEGKENNCYYKQETHLD